MSIAKEMHEVAAFQFAFFSALNFTEPKNFQKLKKQHISERDYVNKASYS